MIVKYTTGFLLVIFLLISGTITAQYGFGTNQPDQRSIVHIVSQDSTKGFIIPIVKNGAIAANPAIKGMLIYNLADNCIKMCDGAAWHCLMGDNSLGATDDQQLDSLRLNGKTLTAYLEDGGSASINIQPVIDSAYTDIASSLLNDNVWLNELRDSINTDQQNLSVGAGTAATSIIDINDGDSIVLREGSNIQLTESGSQITISATGDGTGTDDQNVDSLRLSGTTLTTYLEDGGNASVDLQPIVDSAVANVSSGSDDQNISGSGLSGTNLTIGIEGGSNEVVNLQPIVDSAVANAPSGSDNQNLSVQAGTGTTSVIDVEDGDSVIISAGTGLSISESGNTITLTNTVTDTDTDQQDLSVGAGTAATSIIDINNGDSVVLREGSNIQLTESGSQITISATGDGTGTDDQNLTLGAGTGTTSILDMESGSDVTIQAGSNITLSESGSTLTIAATGDGTGTDDQNISGSGLSGTNLTIGIEGGSNQLVNLQPIVDSAVANAPSGSDDQNLSVEAGTASTSIVNIENGDSVVFQEGSNIQLTEAGNVITISAPAAGSGTDDQNLSVQAGTGSTSVIDVEDGDSVIISAGTGLSISESGNTITLTNTVTDTDTDQQDLSVGAGTAATSIIDINNGDSVVLREGSNIQLTESGSQITISATGDGTGTDDQNLTLGAGTGTTSILDMESGSDVTIQAGSNITLSESGNTLTIAATGDGTGTDDQNIAGSGLSGTNLTIGIEGGSNQVVNLQPIVDSAVANAPSGSDDQNLSVGAGTAATSIIQMEDGNDITITEGSNIILTESGGNNITIATNADITGVTAGDGLTGGGNSGAVTLNVVATNGLTDAANDVRLGGALVQNTQINQGNFNMTYNLNGTGDFNLVDGATTRFQVTDAGQTTVGALSGAGTRMVVANAAGVLSTQAIPSNGDITAVTAGTGLTGGGTGGAVTVNAVGDNGLTTNADDIDLGGALNQNTTITQGAFSMIYNLDGTGDFLVRDAGTNKFSVQDNGQTRFGGNTQWRSGSTTGTILGQFVDDAGDGRFIVYDGGAVAIDLDANAASVFNQQGVNRDFRVESLDSNGMFFVDASANRVGIGTETPSAMLDVEGKIQTTNFQMTSGATNNYVLTSDASGNGSWQNVTGLFTDSDDQNLSVGAGTAATSIIQMENGNNVTLQEGSNIVLTEAGNTITIAATGDGTGTDDQNLTLGAGTGTTSVLNMENGSDVTIQAGSNITLSESGSTLTIAATGDGTGTDDQNISGSGLSGTNLTIGIENGTNQVVSLASIGGDITAVTAGTGLTGGGTTGAVTINAVGDNGLTTNANDIDLGGTLNQETTLIGMASTGGEVDIFTISDPDVGGSGQDHSSSFKVLRTGGISSASLGQSLTELTYTGGAGSPNTYYIVGRKADEGTVEWGVDLDDDDYWSTGGITLGVTGAATGAYSGGNFRVESNGRTGVGTASPNASYMLDVVGTAHADAINVNGNYTLPTIDGANGQVMQTNGAGTVSWVGTNSFGTDNQNLSVGAGTGATSIIQMENGNDITLTEGSNIILTESGGNNITIATNADITGVTAGDGLTGGGNSGAVTLNVVATNGLTDAANDVRLGGSLVQNTQINQGNFNMTYNLNGTGDFNLVDGATTRFQVTDAGQTTVGALSGAGTRMVVANAAGVLSTQAIPSNGDITAVTAGAGLTGGGSSGAVTVTAAANNGLNVDAGADRIQLGGALTENTTISEAGFTMTHNLTGAGDFRVRDNGAAAFFVRDNGNVGFGTESPSYQIHGFESTSGNATEYASYIDFNGTAAGALTANRTHMGMYIDYDASNIVGTTTNGQRHYAYGVYSNLQANGTTRLYDWRAAYNAAVHNSSADATSMYGAFNYATTAGAGSTGTISNMYGANNYTYLHPSSTGTVSNSYGAQNYVYNRRPSGVTTTNVRGSYNHVNNNGTGTISNVFGSHNYIINNSTGVMTNAYGSYSHINQDDAGGTIANSYAYYARLDRDNGTATNGYLYYGAFQGTHANKWGLYLTGDTRNRVGGRLGVGGDPATGNMLDVNGKTQTTNFQMTNGATNNYVLRSDAAGNGSWVNVNTLVNGDNLGNHTATTTLNMNSQQVTAVRRLSMTATSDYDKLRVWNSGSYTIGMASAQSFGFLNDYAMTFTMNADTDRGWLWRDASDAANDGAMSLTTDGRLTVKSTVDINSLAGSGTRMVVASAGGVLSTQAIPANGDITGVTAGAGLTGGGTSGTVTVNAAANNGLNITSDRIRLGGSLITGTTITQGAYNMNFNLSSTGDFNIQDAGASVFTVLDNGITRLGRHQEWRDGNTGGTLLGQFIDEGTDGRFLMYDNGAEAVDLRPSTEYTFNENSVDVNFRVESNGNANMFFVDGGANRVGVGTGAPAYPLHVVGDGYFEGWIRNTGNRGWYNQTHGGGMYMIDATWIRTYGNKSFYHNTGTMRTDGNFQVGNGGQYASLPSGTTATVFNEGSFDKDFRIESNGNANMFFVNAGTNRVGIGTTAPAQALHVNGRIRSNGINETSDRRYKKDITNLPEDILDKVLKIRGVTYKWRQNEFPKMEFEDGTQIGVIAQEIEEVFPEVVRTDENGYKSVDYSHLVPVLVEALKAENTKVDNQSKRIKKLEEDNKKLLERLSKIEEALDIE